MSFDLFNLPPGPAVAPAQRLLGHIPLRYCQKEDVDAMTHALRSGYKHPSCIAATGYGKSPIIAENVCRMLENGKQLILTDRAILVHQNAETLQWHMPDIAIGRVCEGVCNDIGADVVVSTVQAMYTPGRDGRRLYEYPQFRNVKGVHLDECEAFFAPEFRSVPQYLIDQCGAVVCGYTATPVAASGAAWNTFFDWTAPTEGPCMRTVRWCRDNGYIVPPKQAFVQCSLRLSEIDAESPDRVDDDFADVLMGLLTDKGERKAAEVALGVQEIIGNRSSLIFAPPVRNGSETAIAAKTVASWLSSLIKCEAVWGSRVDRDDVMDRFRRGRTQALANVSMLTTGVDIKHISAVFIFRLVKKWRLTQQMVGRAVRPSETTVRELAKWDGPEHADKRKQIIAESDKPDALVADLVGLDGKVLHASAVDVLYADESKDVRDTMVDLIRSKPGTPKERPSVDDDLKEAAERELARKQSEHLAELARRRAMAGDLPADVSVRYEGQSAPMPGTPSPKDVATAGERAMFVAMATRYPLEDAIRMANSKPRGQIRGMTFSMKRELEKSGARPDWNRARRAFPEWAAQKRRA